MTTSLEKTIPSSDPSRQLAATERDRLSELEPIIERGMASFVEVGTALLEISDRRLYRETHSTFAEYCETKWRMTARRAYQLCEAAEVVNALPENVNNCSQSQITNEGQARELAKVAPPRRAAVLEMAASQGTVTASTIRAAAEAEAKPCVVAHVEVMPRHKPAPPDETPAEEIERLHGQLKQDVPALIKNSIRELTMMRDMLEAEVSMSSARSQQIVAMATAIIVAIASIPLLADARLSERLYLKSLHEDIRSLVNRKGEV